jgi:hypothetical protein
VPATKAAGIAVSWGGAPVVMPRRCRRWLRWLAKITFFIMYAKSLLMKSFTYIAFILI